MTDLYEAGDINQTDGGAAAGTDAAAGDAVDAVGVGNERTGADAGTPLAVLKFLATSLSNEPEAVEVESETRRGGLRLSLHVAPEDMGRVIGRRGRTAQAIRTLVNVAGAKDGVQASVDIVDD